MLAAFAFQLQAQSKTGDAGDKSQVRVDYDEALVNLSDVPDDQQDNLLKAAADLQILDLPGDGVLFVHQLLQEYFAARHLAERINAANTPEALMELVGLAQVQWLEVDIQPGVHDELQALPKSGTLSDLLTTGWEETFMLTAAMIGAADNLLRVLADVNLPLAGRCAAQPDVVVSDNLREVLQQSLVKRNRFKGEAGLLAKLAEEQVWNKERIEEWQGRCAMTDEAFEAMLVERWPDQRFTQPEYWNNPTDNAPNQPVVGVCWFEACAYSAWLSVQTGQPFRLPTEAEWEVATSGVSGRKYAWGEACDATCCNALDTKLRRTTPVGVFPSGDTPPEAGRNGVADLSGNVWEWTSNGYASYPYKTDDGREDAGVEQARVLRGGSWGSGPDDVRSSVRNYYPLDIRDGYVGFRVLCSSPIE